MTPSASNPPVARRRAYSSTYLRWLLPIVLVLFFLAILIWLPWQARQMESNERQEQLIADTLWVEQTIRFQLGRDEESLRALGVELAAGHLSPAQLHERMARVLKNGHELLRVVWLKPDGRLAGSSDPLAAPVELSPASKATAEITRKTRRPMYTQPEAQTHIPSAAPAAVLMDYHVPLFRGDEYLGDLVATYQTSALLDEMVPWWFAQDNQVTLVDRDDKVLARRADGQRQERAAAAA
jgi:two-component system sensor histidine kinase DctS